MRQRGLQKNNLLVAILNKVYSQAGTQSGTWNVVALKASNGASTSSVPSLYVIAH